METNETIQGGSGFSTIGPSSPKICYGADSQPQKTQMVGRCPNADPHLHCRHTLPPSFRSRPGKEWSAISLTQSPLRLVPTEVGARELKMGFPHQYARYARAREPEEIVSERERILEPGSLGCGTYRARARHREPCQNEGECCNRATLVCGNSTRAKLKVSIARILPNRTPIPFLCVRDGSHL